MYKISKNRLLNANKGFVKCKCEQINKELNDITRMQEGPRTKFAT